MILSKKRKKNALNQSVRMRRLVCVFVVRKPPKAGFLASRPISNYYASRCSNVYIMNMGPDVTPSSGFLTRCRFSAKEIHVTSMNIESLHVVLALKSV